MIEQAIFFAIGFLVALLAAVAALPVFWRRAVRLSEARARLRAPLTEQQAVADLNALRAQDAVREVKLARRLELSTETMNSLRADGGRQAVRILSMEADAAEREDALLGQRGQIENLESRVNSLEADLAVANAAVHDALAQRDKAQAAETAAAANGDRAEAELSHDRARIAILTARLESLEHLLEETRAADTGAARRTEEAHSRLSASLAEKAALAARQEVDLRAGATQLESLRNAAATSAAVLEAARKRVNELEAGLANSEKVREDTLLENSRQLRLLAEKEAALRSLEARLASPPEKTLAEDWAMRNPQPDSAASATGGFVQGTTVATKLRPRPEQDAALRESIERLGQEVRSLYAQRTATEGAAREARADNGQDATPNEARPADSKRPREGRRRKAAASAPPKR